MLFNNKFILASSSASRFKILTCNKLSFINVSPRCNEDNLKKKLIKKKISIRNISLELARIKSKSISKSHKNKLVVGCDTVISFDGKILNKAKNLKEAKKKIINFSGKTHFLYSSISVFYNNKEVWKTTEKSKIKIRKLLESEIDSYLLVAGNNILNSVGCYQIEGLGPNIIQNIEGDFFNVMGFPIFNFLSFLKKFKN